MLAAGVTSIDALWLTHTHADHVHGIDDVRALTAQGGDLPTWTAPEYVQQLQERFRYIFDDSVRPPKGSSKPRIVLNTFEAFESITLLGEEFIPLQVPHGGPMVYGFRVGGLGYVTDAKTLPDQALDELRGVDVLVLNALWFGRPHGSHFNIEEAIEAASSWGWCDLPHASYASGSAFRTSASCRHVLLRTTDLLWTSDDGTHPLRFRQSDEVIC